MRRAHYNIYSYNSVELIRKWFQYFQYEFAYEKFAILHIHIYLGDFDVTHR